ncbi:MAG: hypothetical protein EOP84_14080 [Verrucomicrobiaceae bacterium]|nr:MAG: hypothetical protein EOP84_14080 [Verrucomicrobiaceae bacterium]
MAIHIPDPADLRNGMRLTFRERFDVFITRPRMRELEDQTGGSWRSVWSWLSAPDRPGFYYVRGTREGVWVYMTHPHAAFEFKLKFA